uniref:Uncharacterized protein n=1 Tax=Caenorhabditis japonica TaxID=281687 RepID=A0A8R1INZ1_CAEJA
MATDLTGASKGLHRLAYCQIDIRSFKSQELDLLAVNSCCKAITIQEKKRKEGQWIVSSGAELICTLHEAQEGGNSFWIHEDLTGSETTSDSSLPWKSC